MSDSFEHLTFSREEPLNERRARSNPRPSPPNDIAAHGRTLSNKLGIAKESSDELEGGFDERRIFKFTVNDGFTPEDLRKLSSPDARAGIQVLSQETNSIVVALVSEPALDSFEALLTTLAGGKEPTNKQVFYALQGVDSWTAEDRLGWALRHHGVPIEEPFKLDVELWPLEDSEEARAALCEAFEAWLQEHEIGCLDTVKQLGIILYRVHCGHAGFDALLRHRDVRTVDLPPKFGIDLSIRVLDLQEFDPAEAPPESSPVVTILDSGIASNHPLLSAAVGDSQSFYDGKDAADESGHGTLVGGIAVYGDIESRATNRNFAPELVLCSGRILNEDDEADGFVENTIRAAVEYFHREYDCKIFNLSFGDANKPYLGGHIRELAFTLDSISRELSVLFIVSAGNVPGNKLHGLEWKNRYPAYFREEDWALIDPATALNAITVGSLARHDQTTNSQRYANDPAEQPIAIKNQPSPFTHCGPSVRKAIKPDVVAYGGNWALLTRGGANQLVPNSGLGELSLNSTAVADGRLFTDDSGTSFAAPHVTHLAGKLLNVLPDANSNLIRALLVNHARRPDEVLELFDDNTELIERVTGYGLIDETALFQSLETEVTVIASDKIQDKRHQFYELPIPESFLTGGRRDREISVCLAFTPAVRSTRVDYIGSRLDFRLVTADSLDDVSTRFDKETSREDWEALRDAGQELSNSKSVQTSARSKGTVQSSTWTFRQINRRSRLINSKLFVVVTRSDTTWGSNVSSIDEDYSLVATFRDRDNAEAQLYTQLRAQLQARLRARARV